MAITGKAKELRLRRGGVAPLTEWGVLEDARAVVGIVHGWGLHPRLYGPVVSELLDRGAFVTGVALPSASQPRRRLGFSLVSDAVEAFTGYADSLASNRDLAFVGESLGATYLIAQGPRVPPTARLALIAPGILLRPSQLISWRALSDLVQLLVHDRVDLSWRLATASTNSAFIRQVQADPGTLKSYTRAYARAAVAASLIATSFGAPKIRSEVRIWQGTADRLLSLAGTRLLLHRLGTRHKSLVLVERGEHGLIWDTELGAEVSRDVANWATGH